MEIDSYNVQTVWFLFADNHDNCYRCNNMVSWVFWIAMNQNWLKKTHLAQPNNITSARWTIFDIVAHS